jgi:surfeit locus 1 family protein
VYDFVRTPRWIAGHALALAGIIAFVNLGLWQLDRLEERRTYNATVASRLAAPAQPLAGVLEEVGGDPEALAYRRVTATGRYAPEEEVLLSPRSYQGTPGHHLLTPLETGDGTGVAVDRGWVPLELDDPPVAEAAPPSGEVAVTGVLFPPFADRRGVTGEVDLLTQPDIARYQEQVPIDLAPVYLLAQDRTGDLPVPGELPTLDEGNHLSYAVQWFVFATVVAVGYPLLLRRTARDRQRAFDDLRRDTPQPAGRTSPAS